jgi:Tol biopolymer transport system component
VQAFRRSGASRVPAAQPRRSGAPGGARRIEIVDLASRELARIGVGFLRATEPAWSPDGRRLAFTGRANAESSFDLFVVDLSEAEPSASSEEKRP